MEAPAEPLPIVITSLAHWEGPGWLEVGKCACLQKGEKEAPEGGSVSLTSVPGKVMEQIILSCHRAARTGQPGDQAQSARVCERQVLLDQPDLLL